MRGGIGREDIGRRKWRASPYNFTEGGKWEWRETEIRTVVKVLLNVFAFPSEEEMKAYVNKPLHPILSIPVPSFRQRKAVLKHQWCSIETRLDHLITFAPAGFMLGITESLWAR